jgi:FtsH-binding integral membrane protein
MNIVDFIIGCLVLPAMVLVIIVSGVYIMTSIGNPGKVELGKKVLLAGIIGLIIVSAAHAFLQVWAPKLELPSPPPLPSK